VLLAVFVVGCAHKFGDVDEIIVSGEDARTEPDTRVPFDSRAPRDTWFVEDTAEPVEDVAVFDARPPVTPSTTKCSFARKWSTQGATNDEIYAPADIAVDKAGNVYVAGAFHGKSDFGFGTVGGPLYGVFALKLDKSGTPLWARTWSAAVELGKTNYLQYGAMGLDPTGGIVLGGTVTGALDLGGGSFPSSSFGIAFVKLDSDGNHEWSRRSTGAKGGFLYGIAVDAAGNATLAGGFDGPMDFGLGALTYVGDPWADYHYHDAFVARFDSAGRPLWNRSYGDSRAQSFQDLALAPGGDIVLWGAGAGFVDFGGGALGAGATSQQSFLVRLDAEGRHVFSRAFVSTGYPGQVMVTPGDDIVVAGSGRGEIALGGPLLVAKDAMDGWVARYDGRGVHRWSQLFGGSSDDGLFGVTLLPDGSFLASGMLGDQLSVAGKSIVGAGWDGMLVRLGAGGVVDSVDRFGDAKVQRIHRTAVAEDGKSFWMIGTFTGKIDVGTGPLTASSLASDLFLARCPL